MTSFTAERRRPPGLRRALVAAVCAGLGLSAGLHSAVASEPISRTYKIAAQPISTALKAFAAQSDLQLIFTEEDVGDARTNGVDGSLPPREALSRMLRGTGLGFEFTANHVVVVRKAGAQRAAQPVGNLDPEHPTAASQSTRLATTDAANGQSDAALSEHGQRLEEVIVSATKRESRLQDTPLSLSVLGSEELERRSLVSATDYLNSVPGVHLDSYGLTENKLVIRGLGLAKAQTPTTGAYLGDVPLSDALDFYMTDVKLVDMARVEVLRGPQGTLYGAGAMGGAVRQIPAAPVLDQLSGKLKLGYASTAHSSDPSYDAVGVFNVPLVDGTLALRTAAYHFKKAGYVDLVSTPAMAELSASTQVPVELARDTGGREYSGLRTTALFVPSDRLDMSLMLGYQKLKENGLSEVAMNTDEYVYSTLRTGREFREQEFKYANLVVNYHLPWATLTSSSSWTRTGGADGFSHSRVLPSASHVSDELTKQSWFQELRLATTLDGPMQVVGGGYYENIKRDSWLGITWESPNLALMQDFWGTQDPHMSDDFMHADLRQLAAFGELSYRLAEPLTLTVGARWFDYARHDSAVSYAGVAPGVAPLRSDTGDLPAKEDGQVFKVGLDYKPTDQAMLYATWSQGFRLGQTIDSSAYSLFGDVCDANHDGNIDGTNYPYASKVTLKSDSINNYELGGKFTLLDGRLSLNAALYRIDWRDVPVSVSIDVGGLGCRAQFNGGKARSQGLELEAVWRATDQLDVSLSGSLTDTEYRDDLSHQRGQRLPFSPKYNARLGAQYNFDLLGRKAFVRSDLTYVGNSLTNYNPPNVPMLDAYKNWGARAGVAFERFNLELYGTNLTNEDVLVGVANLNRGWRMEPRVIGVGVDFNF